MKFRELSFEEILGRSPIQPDLGLMEKDIADRTVLVTGAGGSIGSELCRRILQNNPKVLVLCEISEVALYLILEELEEYCHTNQLDVQIEITLTNLLDLFQLKNIFRTFTPDVVYHAAAYKHVPIVERNIWSSLNNNVVGTMNLVECVHNQAVRKFVLISSDKAVRPTNIMGASKRIAELLVQAYSKFSECTFCIVRFGNVIGSSGSVVPKFYNQIRSGGPVTLTHDKMRRYFMTPHEAASLVIQAGAMSKGGEVFLLDMGKEIRIKELAINMIYSMGYSYNEIETKKKNIKIVVTGLRPGEKLYEEMFLGSNVQATAHDKIFCALESSFELPFLQKVINEIMENASQGNEHKLKLGIAEIVEGYSVEQVLDDPIFSQ